ncbi:D-alanine--D-alanine ligase [Psychromonas sp. RZ22]|uniref:D-alanine--D-alanine ligase n=1 Tax=Psychromonas algarum TaxID=2555643 RepID=UPI001067AFB3|nr:D-alanine--D-alanine ligase [Psychromonas sp. RZ22]TEW54920.1 D-alanine--D-alanine ligase [Psychromonas sp. RZ22]
MKNDFGKVAVLFGGNSAEREVSLNSGNAVLNALIRGGVDAHGIDPKFNDISQIKAQGFERAFIVLHGRGGEDGVIQGFLSALNIPFTGSDVSSSAIGMDKAKTKQIWQCYGLPTANYQIIVKENFESASAADILEQLSGAVMVKPIHEGSSIGMAKAENPEQLIAALEEAFKFDDKVLLESWITGDEFTVSMLNGKALPAVSMKTTNQFYDYQAKYQSTETQYLCPCGLSDEELTELNLLAEEAFKTIGCSGWGRVDFMRDSDKNWYLLEVNTVPGMTETSLVPKAAKEAGISFDQLVLDILKQTL